MKRAHTLHYQSFLIRFWQDSDGGPWRGSLEDPRTGEQRSFARLDDLLDFLKAQTNPAHTTPLSHTGGDSQ